MLAEVAESESLLPGLPYMVDYCTLFNIALSRYFGKPMLAALRFMLL
jgi:hypothetical protein